MTAFETILYPNNVFRIPISRPRRIIITVLDDEVAGMDGVGDLPTMPFEVVDDFETPLAAYLGQDDEDVNLAALSQLALAVDWLIPEEDMAWAGLSQLPRCRCWVDKQERSGNCLTALLTPA